MKSPDSLQGIEISEAVEDIISYSYDSSIAEPAKPKAVAWPRNTEQVLRLLDFAKDNRFSIVPRGAGSGMAGASVPAGKETIVMSFEKMRKIIDIDTRNMTVVVEPGIINGRLQRELEYMGYFYPPDPASINICTIGGNVATNAGGPRAVKYGVTRDYVMGIEAVLADGTVINAGGKTHKRTVGYDLRNLLTGSEGTLALFTRIRLKILPLPEDVVTLLLIFRDIESAGAFPAKMSTARVIPRTMEFMDRSAIEAIEKYKPTGFPPAAEAVLLVELDGYPATIRKEAERVVDICRNLGGEAVMAEDDPARESLWEARRVLSPALYRIKPNKLNEDIVVPRDKLSPALVSFRKLSEDSGIKIVCFGHAGDGNIHVNIMIDKTKKEEYQKGLELVRDVFDITLRLGGSISGEHGIGLVKMPYIGMEVKEKELQLMRGVKKLFDPEALLNPGKIIP
ncbi:MAG: FAD-binding protein [Nitrospirae bacterium]|nr:MAG: FAD-binding protein [Nitrospirota bacterium]